MADIGSLDKRVNSQGYRVYINTSSDDEYIFMQNASMSVSHSEFREPTTSGINVYYSGLPDNVLSGTLLFTTDFGNTNTNDTALEDLLAATNGGEYPIKQITNLQQQPQHSIIHKLNLQVVLFTKAKREQLKPM